VQLQSSDSFLLGMFSPPIPCCYDFLSPYFHWKPLSKYIAHPGAGGHDEGVMVLCGLTDHTGVSPAP